MNIYTGAQYHRLFSDWVATQPEPERVWASDFYTLGARGLSLACNDPIAAAMANAYVQGIHGPLGLRMESQYDSQPDSVGTTTSDRAIRRQITAMVADTWYGTDLDAGGMLTRSEMERALSWCQFVIGDAWAIRVQSFERPGVSFSNCWRLIPPHRVQTFGGGPIDKIRDGIEYENGRCSAIHINASVGLGSGPQTWKRIPWYAEDGTPNVIHRCGPRLLGMSRGVSMLAPAIMTMRQAQGVMEAHVLGKKIQAMFPLLFEVNDPERFKEYQAANAVFTPGMKLGPTSTLVTSAEDKITLPEVKYDGADFKEFMMTVWRAQSSAIGFPLEVVLCMMGDASLASAKAGLDLFDRQCQTYQESAISQVTSQIDRARIAEGRLSGQIAIPDSVPWSRVMTAEWNRPPKYSVDRKKDMETVKAALEAGASKTTAFKIVGMRYEDEIENKVAESEFESAQVNSSNQRKDAAFVERIKATKAAIDSAQIEGVTWPAVIAASGAESAPGAYIAATGSSLTAESSAGVVAGADGSTNSQKSTP